MKQTNFSIVMPYYKNLHVVKRAIESVLKQTYSNFELLIIDDGSEDAVSNIISEVNDSRIKLISKENGGVSTARNKGIDEAQFEWICFLDSDDEWKEQHLETLKNMIDKYSDKLFFITSYMKCGDTMEIPMMKVPKIYPEDFLCDDLLGFIYKYGHIIHTNSICIAKKVFDIVGRFEEGINIGEDLDLWYRCAMLYSVVVSRTVTTIYHRDASFLTKTTNFAKNWILCQRLELFENHEISIERKQSLKIIVRRNELSQCKHMLATGEKKEAKELFKKLKEDIPNALRKSQIQVQVLIFLPRFLSEKICKIIYKQQSKKY